MKQYARYYSAGFIYNSRTKKLLLALKEDTTEQTAVVWSLFGGLNKRKENPQATFQREILEATGVRLPKKSVQSLYDYKNDDFGVDRHVFYVLALDIKNLQKRLKHLGFAYEWVSLDAMFDQNLSKRTKQDLTYFYRELEAKERKDAPVAQPQIASEAFL